MATVTKKELAYRIAEQTGQKKVVVISPPPVSIVADVEVHLLGYGQVQQIGSW